MARVSQDSDSWKARGVLNRDARHTHDDPDFRHPGKRKNTKRWCKGNVGRKHTLKTRPIRLGVGWMGKPRDWGDEDYCTVCSKVVTQRYKRMPWARSKPILIEKVFTIKGGGKCAALTLTGDPPQIGGTVWAVRTGRHWVVKGIENHLIPREPTKGDSIALLLEGDKEFRVGDYIRWEFG